MGFPLVRPTWSKKRRRVVAQLQATMFPIAHLSLNPALVFKATPLAQADGFDPLPRPVLWHSANDAHLPGCVTLASSPGSLAPIDPKDVPVFCCRSCVWALTAFSALGGLVDAKDCVAWPLVAAQLQALLWAASVPDATFSPIEQRSAAGRMMRVAESLVAQTGSSEFEEAVGIMCAFTMQRLDAHAPFGPPAVLVGTCDPSFAGLYASFDHVSCGKATAAWVPKSLQPSPSVYCPVALVQPTDIGFDVSDRDASHAAASLLAQLLNGDVAVDMAADATLALL